MSGFTKFAVAGAGNFGKFIVKELLELKKNGSVASVSVLTRSASNANSTELAGLGATIVEVDYESAESISKALAGIDVAICAFSPMALGPQNNIADSAKAAGVKLFVPSEYGVDTEDINKIPFQRAKFELQKKLKDMGLPYTLFQTGTWSDMCFFNPHFGMDLSQKKMIFGGKGDGPISFTARDDAARFIAHALVAFPKEKLEWKSIRMEGDRQSMNSFIAQYEALRGVKIDVTRIPAEELEARLKENSSDIVAMFLLAWDRGGGAMDSAGLSNGEWPEWNPKSVIDVVASVA
ncbi:NAD-P-binding protein [Schizopora paradoxa]|uniref:NAD-P-binding protein n=1 Tax=Schizopora paradoxa TaxID=27342 RepID=A0A0H2R764_9AGAM|nr:NAD-P-binding protein [Schizopora paradoxa]